MDSISKLKSKFQTPSVRNKRGPSILDNLPSNRSTSTSSNSNQQSLKRPKSNLFLPDVDDDDDVEEGQDWIVGYQSTKKQKLDSNGSPAPSRSNSNNHSDNGKTAPFKTRTTSSNSDSFSSNINKQSPKTTTTTALTPKQAPNPTSTSSNSMTAPGGSNSDKYYLCQYRKPQARKHKTWDGDAILIVTNNGATCSLKCADTARDLVTGAKFGHGHLEADAELAVGGKELEIEREISRQDYLGGSPWSSSAPIARPKAALPQRTAPAPFKPPQARIPTPKIQSNHNNPQSKNQGQNSLYNKSKPSLASRSTSNLSSCTSADDADDDGDAAENVAVVTKKGVSASAFYANKDAPAAKKKISSIGLVNAGQGSKAHPRFPPDAPGALVMKRPDEAHQKKFNRKGHPIVDVVLDPSLSAQLRPHQVEGVKFLYEIVMGMRNPEYQGAILADEMGLGKTLQTIALCSMLLRQNCYYTPASATIDRVLIVCPLSLVKNWKREFRKWIGNNSINVLAIDSSGHQKIESFVRSKTYQVLIIGYEKLRTCIQVLKGVQPQVGLIVCDEGHRLKSKDAKTTKMFDELTTPRRIILSGTPIQNDLSEFYAMIDFVNPGLLGNYNAFKKVFEDPIVKSRVQNARKDVREIGEGRTQQLAKVTSGIILRRTADLLNAYLLPKVEFVVFVAPTWLQLSIYKSVLGSNLMRQVLNGAASNPLVLIGHLRKLCNSPELLIRTLEEEDKGEESVGKAMLGDVLKQYPKQRVNCDPELSGKMMALMNILRKTRETTQDKVVVCSNFTATLDIIEGACRKSRYSFVRLDGKTKEADRMDIVNTFNKSTVQSSFVFLLSAKSGGVGLNLIGANRLVLFDSDWNPATDLQVMARIHRDGQKKTCYIYRLLIAGTMDEKIFQRQLSKMGLSDSLMDSNASASKTSDSFSAEELRDIFRLHEDTKCLSHDHLCCSCGGTGKLIDSRNSGKLGVGAEEDSDDEQEEEQGFMLASQHNVTQAQQNARDKRSKLVALFDWAHLDCTKPSASEELVDPILKAIVTTQAPPRALFTQSQSQSTAYPVAKGHPLLHPNPDSSDSLLPGSDDTMMDQDMDLLDQVESEAIAQEKDQGQEQKKSSLLELLDGADEEFHIKKEVIDSDPTSSPERSEDEKEKSKTVAKSQKRKRNSSSPPIDSEDEDQDEDGTGKDGDSSSVSSSQAQDVPSSGSFNVSGMDPGAVLYVFTRSASQLTEAKKMEEMAHTKKLEGKGKGKGKGKATSEDEDEGEKMEVEDESD